jgi:hypothetical protein
MNEDMRMWMEITFNLLYLVAVWVLVLAMLRWLPRTDPANRAVNRLFIAAFGLLALGDTGHVGFRVLAYSQGDLNATFTLFGGQVGLVGLGALSTAITVTFFYVIMLMIWRERFDKPYGWFQYVLFAAAIARLLVMIPAQNEWNSTVPPQPWSFYRNLPLIIQGLGVAYLILRDAIATDDRVFKWVGVCILISYGFYLPVIFFVQQVPVIGMLMIPKTLAYVAIAILAYLNLFRGKLAEQSPIEQRA